MVLHPDHVGLLVLGLPSIKSIFTTTWVKVRDPDKEPVAFPIMNKSKRRLLVVVD